MVPLTLKDWTYQKFWLWHFPFHTALNNGLHLFGTFLPRRNAFKILTSRSNVSLQAWKHNYDQPPNLMQMAQKCEKTTCFSFNVLYSPALELHLPQQMKRLRMNLKLRSHNTL